MTGEEMERAIDFLLQNQTTLEQRVERTQQQISETQGQLSQTVEAVAELNRVVRMQADSQSQFNQTLTMAVTALAEAQTNTEARLADLVGKLAGGQG